MRRIWGFLGCVVLLAGCDQLFGKGDDTGDDDVFIDAGEPTIDAEPARFEIGGRVANLLGAGLVLELDGGEQLTFDEDMTFAFTETRLAGADYTVTIAAQPATQTCELRNGDGTIGTDDVDDIEVECAVGTLRITEVSTCFFANVPCWVEIFNTSTTDTENLSAYQLRSNASPRAGGTITVRSFTLPSLAIPPGGYALVRGRGSDDLVDGLNLVNLLEAGDLVPYWTENGFVELLKSSKTVDFVRFGTSNTNPTTIGWNGAGAPMVPATDVYGAVVARDATASDTNAGADWALRAFGTPGGVNDITSDADTDVDGIPDQAEMSGGRFAGLDLFAMGARTGQPDIFIEIDYMTSADPGVTPREGALDKLVAAFAARGIAVHPDVGSLISDYDLGGGNAVANSALISLGAFGGAANHYALKAANMDVRRQAYAHYAVFAEELTNVPDGTAGLAEVEGNDLVVALGFLNLPSGTTANNNRLDNYQATTLMHELGHNLGLLHDGNQDDNFKANYVSVMNYMYSFSGLPSIGTDEGDRYRLFRAGAGCDTTGESGLTNSPYTTTYIMSFSDGSSMPLTETALVETEGLRRNGSTGVDFNCNDTIAGTVSVDVVAGLTTLNDHNDWANLKLDFVRTGTGASFLLDVQLDHFADEVRPLADESGFLPPR